MNFAEELVYWYLRLNGFFPLTNFVLHRDKAQPWTSDADVLAVRFPHVSEEIGGNPEDWDPRFGRTWGLDLAAETIGLIVEIKSGRWSGADLNGREAYVRRGLRRIGMLAPDQLDETSEALSRASIARVGGFTSAKLFVANGRMSTKTPWLQLKLHDADAFVRQRTARYRDPKLADRLFFRGDLIQYLAWKGGGDRE